MSTGNSANQRGTPSIKRQQYHRFVRSQHLKQKFSSARKAFLANQTAEWNKNYSLHENDFSSLLDNLQKQLITYAVLKKMWQMIKENCFLVDLFNDEHISRIIKYGLTLTQSYSHYKYQQLCMVLLILINWYGRQNVIKFFDIIMLLIQSAFKIKNEYAIMQFIIILLGNIVSETEVKKKVIQLKIMEQIIHLEMSTALIEDVFFVIVNLLSDQVAFPACLLKKIWEYCQECYQFIKNKNDISTIFQADMFRIACKLFCSSHSQHKEVKQYILPSITKLISQALKNDLQANEKYEITIWKIIQQLLNIMTPFTQDIIDKILIKVQNRISKINIDLIEDPQKQLSIRTILWAVPRFFTRKIQQLFFQWCLANIEQYGFDYDNVRRAIIFLSSQKILNKSIRFLDIMVNKFQDYQNQSEIRLLMLNKIHQILLGLSEPSLYVDKYLMSILNKIQFDQDYKIRESADKILKLSKSYSSALLQTDKEQTQLQQEL